MAGNSPLVSIGVPMYNGAAYLLDTLNSIRRQTYPNIELIIVDDGSSDNSYELSMQWASKQGLDVILLRNETNKGLPATCNILLRKAKGKYLQLLGQDDILLPGKIEEDVKIFQLSAEDTALVFSKVKLINADGKLTGEDYFDRIGFNGKIKGPVFCELVKKNFIPAPTALMRTEMVKAVGGYDESLLFEDWDMWLRLSKMYKVVFNDVCNVCYRIHLGSMMADRDTQKTIRRNDADLRMFQKHLDCSNEYDNEVLKKIKELSIYSYFIGDKNARHKMRLYLTKKKDRKILFYYLLASLGIKHPSNLFKTNEGAV